MSPDFYIKLALWSRVAGSILFAVVAVWLWYRFAAPAVLKWRDDKNAALADAERRRDEAKADIAVAEAELAGAKRDAEAIRARGAQYARHVREQITGDAASEGRRVIGNARGELERGRMAARSTLRTELLAKALEYARDTAGYLGDEVNRRLIGEVIDSLERRASTSLSTGAV